MDQMPTADKRITCVKFESGDSFFFETPSAVERSMAVAKKNKLLAEYSNTELNKRIIAAIEEKRSRLNLKRDDEVKLDGRESMEAVGGDCPVTDYEAQERFSSAGVEDAVSRLVGWISGGVKFDGTVEELREEAEFISSEKFRDQMLICASVLFWPREAKSKDGDDAHEVLVYRKGEEY